MSETIFEKYGRHIDRIRIRCGENLNKIKCPSCGYKLGLDDWRVSWDRGSKNLILVCRFCKEYGMPVIIKGKIEPEKILFMDLQKRIRELENKI